MKKIITLLLVLNFMCVIIYAQDVSTTKSFSSINPVALNTVFYLSGKPGFPNDFTFNNDGTKMFVVGGFLEDKIVEYSLTTAFDIATATYAGEGKEYDISSQTASPLDITFDNSGSKMFIVDNTNDKIIEYWLTNSFDLTSVIRWFNHDVIGFMEYSPTSLTFNNDGTKMFIVGLSKDIIEEFTLTVAFDLSTAISNGKFERLYVGPEEGRPFDFTFNNDGTKMFVVGDEQNAVFEYSLTTAFDVSTASYAGDTDKFYIGDQLGITSNIGGINFNSDGTKMFIKGKYLIGVNTTRDAILEYSLTNPFDISGAEIVKVADAKSSFSVDGSATLVPKTTTGIEERKSIVDSNMISVYPNPIEKTLHIRLQTGDGLEEVQVYNLSGEKIMTSKESITGVDSLASGVYLLKVITKAGDVAFKKIIKE